MTVSQEFIGAWRRVGLVLDGIRRVDFCDVLWLQSADWYVDIRTLIQPDLVPGPDEIQHSWAKEFSFAGTSEFTDPLLLWRHELDSRGQAPPDESPVAWQDRLMLESGSFEWEGREVPFVEEWAFLGDAGVTGSGGDGFVRVEAAGFAIEARQTSAGYSAVKYLRAPDGWLEIGRVSSVG